MNISSNKKLITRLLMLTLVLSSCSVPYRSLTIETARPSSHLLPKDIHSLTLVNRGVTNEFRNFNEDSLQQFFYNKGFNYQSVILDSLAADTTLKALGTLLYESGRYDVVIPEERNLNRNLKFYLMPQSLDWDEVASICKKFNTDALMVIERYYDKLLTEYHLFVPSGGMTRYASATIDSKYDAVVKVYDPVKKEITRQLLVDDTISWQDADGSTKALFKRLPSIKQCLIQTGIQVALDIDSHFSPTWVKESRIFFLLADGDASRIQVFADQHDWQGAYDYWLNFAQSSKTTIRSKAEFNLALAAEMLGELDLSIEWANKSYYTKYMNQTNNYLLKLKQRQQILKRFE